MGADSERKWTDAELCALANATGERLAAKRAADEARKSAEWREREGKRLAMQQAAPEMYEALRESRDLTHWEEWARDQRRVGLREDVETYRAGLWSAALAKADGRDSGEGR